MMGAVGESRASLWGRDAPSAVATGIAVAITWFALKMVALWGWVLLPGEYGNTYYYFLTAQEQASRAPFPEYPTPTGFLLALPYALGAHDYESYRMVIIVATTVTDGLFTLILGRRTGPVGVFGWMVLTTVLGQVALLRFDMLPAVAAAVALLLAVEGRSRIAAVVVAVGTGLKIWPVILAPLVILGAKRRWQAVAWFAGTGAVLVAWSLLVGGWARLLAPLSYQSERGLQIESVAATLPMREWATEPGSTVWYSSFHAYEVVGPHTDAWLYLAGVASWFALVGCVALTAYWYLRGRPLSALVYLGLTFIGAFIVTSPALSPQYLLWIAAPTAVLLGLVTRAESGPAYAPAVITWVGAVALCLLTTAVYPVNYSGLTGQSDATTRALTYLTWRNVGLIALVAWTAVMAWSETRRERIGLG